MKNRSSVIISILITVVVLTIAYGVTSAIAKGNASQTASASEMAAYYATREAQYQSLIAQANNTISQANQQIAALQSQGQAAPTTAAYAISADQAVVIAQTASGETASETPSLVNYSGAVAYEVVLPDGKVYVDANNGTVLYNGVIHTITAQQAAQIAINYVGNSQVVDVVSGYYGGVAAFRVTFQNGEIVYLNAYGSIIAVQPAPASSSGSHSGENDGEND
jgi:uncharacterized membrane protein YkoI